MELTPKRKQAAETQPARRRSTSLAVMVLLMLCLLGAGLAFFGPAIIGIFQQQQY